MTLGVIGDSSNALTVAAVASAMASEPVVLLDGSPKPMDRRLAVTGALGELTAEVHIRPDIEASLDAYLFVPELLASARGQLARHAAHLAGRPLLFSPGGVGVSTLVAGWARDWDTAPPAVLDGSGFPLLGRAEGDQVVVRAVKRYLPYAPLERGHTGNHGFHRYLPWLEAVDDPLLTMLANPNNFVHPVITLVNIGRVDHGQPWGFYRDGLTRSAGALLEAVDAERLAVTDRVGSPRVSLLDWFRRFYEDQGLHGSGLHDALSQWGPFAGSEGPTGLAHRFIVDDIRWGMAPFAALAERLGVRLKLIPGIVAAFSEITGIDLSDQAAALADSIMGMAAARA